MRIEWYKQLQNIMSLSLLLVFCYLPSKAQEESVFYLVVLETTEPLDLHSKVPDEVKVHLRIAGGHYQEWWIVESTSVRAMNKALANIYKGFPLPLVLEGHRIRISNPPRMAIGQRVSLLRYNMLDYGIKMTDPTDNGYALIDHLEDYNVEGIWMLTEQFEGFYLSTSHSAAELDALSKENEQVKSLKLSYATIDLIVLESGAN